MIPLLFSCEAPHLLPEERAFFSKADPFGFLVFKRNCADRDQLRALVDDLRQCVGRDAPVFIDQEGGRVARLGPPSWTKLPSMGKIGDLYCRDPEAGLQAARAHAIVTAKMLSDVGIQGNFAPVLDLRLPETSSVIGDRAFSADPHVVTILGRLLVDTYLSHGILPVIKHLPGHGRVKTDPHHEKAYVDVPLDVLREADFLPFQALADAPCAMNCHVIYEAIDPLTPVSQSSFAHQTIIRGELGFKGLLFSDDLSMKALSVSPSDRVIAALQAGADIALYTPGTRLGALPEMQEIADRAPPLSAVAQERFGAACARLGSAPSDQEYRSGLEDLRRLLN